MLKDRKLDLRTIIDFLKVLLYKYLSCNYHLENCRIYPVHILFLISMKLDAVVMDVLEKCDCEDEEGSKKSGKGPGGKDNSSTSYLGRLAVYTTPIDRSFNVQHNLKPIFFLFFQHFSSLSFDPSFSHFPLSPARSSYFLSLPLLE